MEIVACWKPIAGRVYEVTRYHTGNFVGVCLSVDRDIAIFEVTDPMRPAPRIDNRCAFPNCVREDFHQGEHEFARIRKGGTVQIFLGTPGFLPAGKLAA